MCVRSSEIIRHRPIAWPPYDVLQGSPAVVSTSMILAKEELQESERFRSFSIEELLKRDKLSLNLCWLRDENLEGTDKIASTC